MCTSSQGDALAYKHSNSRDSNVDEYESMESLILMLSFIAEQGGRRPCPAPCELHIFL